MVSIYPCSWALIRVSTKRLRVFSAFKVFNVLSLKQRTNRHSIALCTTFQFTFSSFMRSSMRSNKILRPSLSINIFPIINPSASFEIVEAWKIIKPIRILANTLSEAFRFRSKSTNVSSMWFFMKIYKHSGSTTSTGSNAKASALSSIRTSLSRRQSKTLSIISFFFF